MHAGDRHRDGARVHFLFFADQPGMTVRQSHSHKFNHESHEYHESSTGMASRAVELFWLPFVRFVVFVVPFLVIQDQPSLGILKHELIQWPLLMSTRFTHPNSQ